VPFAARRPTGSSRLAQAVVIASVLALGACNMNGGGPTAGLFGGEKQTTAAPPPNNPPVIGGGGVKIAMILPTTAGGQSGQLSPVVAAAAVDHGDGHRRRQAFHRQLHQAAALQPFGQCALCRQRETQVLLGQRLVRQYARGAGAIVDMAQEPDGPRISLAFAGA